MAESALPFPTPTRLRLADAIAAGRVRHYPFQRPQTFNDTNGQLVTAKVQLLLAAGLVEVPDPPADYNYSIVRLTPEGMAWVTRARTAQFRNCDRCNASAVLVRCCSSHDKNLCHRCYRQTHFVEVCVASCSACAREGLPREMHYWESGPVSTSPETGPEPCVQCCGEPGCLRHGCKHARAESTKDGT